MATLAQFSVNIRRRGRQVENAGSRVVKTISKRALRSLVRATPVDKGVARSNWRVGLGAAPTAVIKAYSPGRNLGIGETSNARAAIAAGDARIDSIKSGSGGLKVAVIISNNVPYIGKLNSGSSKQAAAGFVEIALIEARLAVRNFKVFDR